MKAPGKRATKKVADHPPRLTIKVGLSASELRLAAKAARQKNWTTEEIVQEFLQDGLTGRPKAIGEAAARGGGAGSGTKGCRPSSERAKGKI